ncbi:hypothetical protein ACEU59_07500 [Buttiauxella noackiae]|uniref:hypothetical protein n=1 Tax=Buttiauxella noackiae TaxID=82992 RepID=UPI0035A70192
MVKHVERHGKKQLLNLTKNLASTHVKIGYFADQGIHEGSGMSYVELMNLQEVKGVRSKNGLIRRRAFAIGSGLHAATARKRLMQGLVKAFRGGSSSPVLVASQFGKDMQKAVKDAFGNAAILPHNAEATVASKGKDAPLVDTGDLMNKLTYRVITKS